MTKIRITLNMSRIVMTDLEFLNTAESLLSRIETSCDRINDETDADIDNQRVGGMITITFSNRSQIIVNLQSHCTKCGWPPNRAVITTSSKKANGKTPKARASFLKTCRALAPSNRVLL